MASTYCCNTGHQSENEHTNGPEGIAPSPSASERSSMTKKWLPCDVYISHCFSDCKASLATDLYYKPTGMGLRVFLKWYVLDSENLSPTEVEEAMRSAWLHIIVFSFHYAESSQCLAELSFMLKTGARIVPVFYRIQPDDVRSAKGGYAYAFSCHEKTGRYTSEKLQEWKEALQHVPYHLGQIVTNRDDASWLYKNIVNNILEMKKNKPLAIGKYPVGLNEVVRDFEKTTLQFTESHHYPIPDSRTRT